MRCGCRVGWSDDRAQRDRRGPWQRRYERAGDDGDSGGRETDREYDQPGHRRPVVPEISRRRVVRCIEQYGCDEERQRKLGWDGERRRAWKKGEQRTPERQEYRIRCADAARPRRQDHGREEEAEKVSQFSDGLDQLLSRRAIVTRFRPSRHAGGVVDQIQTARFDVLLIAGDRSIRMNRVRLHENCPAAPR